MFYSRKVKIHPTKSALSKRSHILKKKIPSKTHHAPKGKKKQKKGHKKRH